MSTRISPTKSQSTSTHDHSSPTRISPSVPIRLPSPKRLSSATIQDVIDESLNPTEYNFDNFQDLARLEVPRTVSWVQIAAIMGADVIGIGVLTMPTAFQQLGWIPGILLNIIFALWAYYTAYQQTRLLRITHWIHSFSDAAIVIVGPKLARYISVMVYCFIFIIVSGAVATSGQSFGVMSPNMCRVSCFFVAMIIIWTVGQTRSLSNVAWTSFLGLITIIIPLILASQDVYANVLGNVPGYEPAPTKLFGDNFVEAMMGCMSIMCAYSGHMMFFEFLSEITDIKDFPKSAASAFTFSFTVYTSIGAFFYAIVGSASWLEAPLTTNMTPGSLKTVITQIFIMIHVTCSAVIMGLFLVRAVQYVGEPAIKKTCLVIYDPDEDAEQIDKEKKMEMQMKLEMSEVAQGEEAESKVDSKAESMTDIKPKVKVLDQDRDHDSTSMDVVVDQGTKALSASPRKITPTDSIHPMIAPYTDWSIKALLWWMIWSAFTYLSATLFALIIPQFNQIVSLGGALIASQSSFGWTSIFELIAAQKGMLRISKMTKIVDCLLVIGFMFAFIAGTGATVWNIIKFYFDNPEVNPFTCRWAKLV